MLHRAAVSLHARITASGAEPPSISIIVYSLEIIVNTFSILGLVILIGFITGEPSRSVALFGFFALIRFISGGYHLPTNAACIAVSTIVLSTLPHIHPPSTLMYTLNGVSFLMMLLFAPSNYDRYARISKKHYPLMKVAACALVGSNFMIGSDLLALAFTTQSLLLPIRGGENR